MQLIDFTSPKLTYRRKNATLKNEVLARALGLKKNSTPKIIDATAGLARDSFILASLGFEITLLERSPIIYDLLQKEFARAKQFPELVPIIEKMHLIHADAIQWLPTLKEKPELIYLDPMFPERKKTAAVKKEMQIFQTLIGKDADEEQLLKVALACATKRVVVKRPRLANPIVGPAPSFSYKGTSSRFDVYSIL